MRLLGRNCTEYWRHQKRRCHAHYRDGYFDQRAYCHLFMARPKFGGYVSKLPRQASVCHPIVRLPANPHLLHSRSKHNTAGRCDILYSILISIIKTPISHCPRALPGQMIVLAAILMPAMLAMVGLVIDGGMSYAEFRRTQTAADSSALAAATYLWKNTAAQCSASSSTPSSDTCGGLSYASVQGYGSDTDATVTITHPAASSGTYASTQYATYGDYVSVTIVRPLSAFFINIIF